MSGVTRDSPLCSSKDSLRNHWNLILPLLLFFFYSHPLGRSQSWPIHFFLPWLFPDAQISRSSKMRWSWGIRRFWNWWICLEKTEKKREKTLYFISVVCWSFLISLFCMMYPVTTPIYNFSYTAEKSRAHCDNSWLFSSSKMQISPPEYRIQNSKNMLKQMYLAVNININKKQPQL